MKVKKAKALWAMKAALDGVGTLRSTSQRRYFSQDKNPSGTVRRTSQKPCGGTGESTDNLWRILTRVGIMFHRLSLPAIVVAMAFSIAGAKILQQMWEGHHWEGVWLYLDPWDVVRWRTSPSFRNVPRKYGSHGELLFSCSTWWQQKVNLEQAVVSLLRRHVAKSPDWSSDGESCSESEGLSSSDFPSTIWKALLCMFIGLNWSGERVSLFQEDWELARMVLSCHVALGMLCQEMHEAW